MICTAYCATTQAARLRHPRNLPAENVATIGIPRFFRIRIARVSSDWRQLFITPEGMVSTCTEVSMIDHPLSAIFSIGHYCKEAKTFVINRERREVLGSYCKHANYQCRSCFAKWHCGGGCLVKGITIFKDRSSFQNPNCQITRCLSAEALRTFARGEAWPGLTVRPVMLQSGCAKKAGET